MTATAVPLTQTDLENALSVDTVAQLFNDAGDGVAVAAAVTAVIARAWGEVESYLVGTYIQPLSSPLDRLVIAATLEFAIAFSFERHPEYIQSFGVAPGKMYERATARMERIREAIQRLPDNNGDGTLPSNVDGVLTQGTTFFVNDTDGRSQMGDW